MFTEEHLRSLAAYLMETATDLEKKTSEKTSTPQLPNVGSGDPPQVTDDPVHALRSFARQIEVTGYDPIIFDSLVEDYDLKVGSIEGPLEGVPLHMNDEDPVSIAVVKWRLANAA
jgi:hypothetical protein